MISSMGLHTQRDVVCQRAMSLNVDSLDAHSLILSTSPFLIGLPRLRFSNKARCNIGQAKLESLLLRMAIIQAYLDFSKQVRAPFM